MQDVEDTSDAGNDLERNSRRERFKDVLSRTKSKWKKEKEPETKENFKLSDDVNEFLAAGRKAAATGTIGLVRNVSRQDNGSPRPSTSDSVNSGQRSPRGIPVPRLDVSQSHRWPNARMVVTDPRSRSDDHLTPDYNNERRISERSHSFNSALAKKRSKPRGLSVAFVSSPPVIIGEGGDRAEAPPFEISRARQRSRSLSPYLDRPSSSLSANSNSPNSRSPVRRKPVPTPPTTVAGEEQDNMFRPKPLRRVQTGFNGQEAPSPHVDKPFETQLRQALRLGEESVLSKPLTDPRIQSRKDPPPIQQLKRPITVQTAVTGHLAAADQSPLVTSAHTTNHPDLQQSSETSKKSPPPKVPNFYAELNRQSQCFEPESPTRVQQFQQVTSKPHLQQSPSFQERSRQNSVNVLEDRARRSHAVQPPPPGGWI